MITLLTGENSFEVEQELKRIITSFDGQAERIDGSELEARQIPDLLMGLSLFAEKRLVIIKSLSENKTIWIDFGSWLGRLSDDIHLVLVEPKPDKRTKTFKELQKIATVRELKPWGERDIRVAEEWALAQARDMDIKLSNVLVRKLVERTGVDQWRVFHALEKLSVLDEITTEILEEIIDSNPIENIFQLFETALKGDISKIRTMLQTIELTEDPYQVFGLLSSQAFQLAALSVSDKPISDVAKDISAHPFVLSKLLPYAKNLSKSDVKKVIIAFSDADEKMKTSVAEPWFLIERALMKITSL